MWPIVSSYGDIIHLIQQTGGALVWQHLGNSCTFCAVDWFVDPFNSVSTSRSLVVHSRSIGLSGYNLLKVRIMMPPCPSVY